MRQAVVMLACASLLSGCAAVPLWQAASLKGKPIAVAEAHYGAPDPHAPGQDDRQHVWSRTQNGTCVLTITTDGADLITGVIMNGDTKACAKLRQRS